jgi:hypothetical protein
MADGDKSRLLPAVLTFFVVTGVVFVAGVLGTWLLRHVVLPVLAVILGYLAARIVYKMRD